MTSLSAMTPAGRKTRRRRRRKRRKRKERRRRKRRKPIVIKTRRLAVAFETTEASGAVEVAMTRDRGLLRETLLIVDVWTMIDVMIKIVIGGEILGTEENVLSNAEAIVREVGAGVETEEKALLGAERIVREVEVETEVPVEIREEAKSATHGAVG
jgi:hypothetical protein